MLADNLPSEEMELEEDELANAEAGEESTASPSIHLLTPRFHWIPALGVEIRSGTESRFSPASTSQDIAESAHIRFYRRSSLGTTATPAAILLPPNGTPLSFHPGAVFQLSSRRLSVRLGRYHLVLPRVSDFEILFPSGAIFHLNAGEVFFELDAQGEGTIAIPRGSGWLKDVARKTQKLGAGKQITIAATGVLARPREIDSRWKSRTYQGFAPVPERATNKPTSEVPEEVQEALADLENTDDSSSSSPDNPREDPLQLASSTRDPGASFPASISSEAAVLATQSAHLPDKPKTTDQLPQVSNSLMSYMSPEARALLLANPAAANPRLASESAPSPVRGAPTQDLLQQLTRQVPELKDLAVPGSSPSSKANDLFRQLQGAAIPIPPITWKYLVFPGFPPIPIPSMALPTGLLPIPKLRR